jgi:hypothetical protein
MKLLTLIIGFIFLGCTQKKNSDNSTVQQTDSLKTVTTSNDKEEIKNLIRNVLSWSESKKTSIDLLPVLTDSKDSVYIGFDLKKHKENLDKLEKTNFFAKEFIENYNQIILTLDKKLRNKEYNEWLVGELPTFIFANDVDPWTSCQDVPYDEPSPWNFVEIKEINLNDKNGEIEWKWGKLKPDTDPSWKEFSYRFKVVKENNEWKVSYLQGFDFKESTRKDGL